MQMRNILLASFILASSTSAGMAEDEANRERYQLEKLRDGFIRLDRQTGDVTYCKEEQTGLVCRMAADERKAFEQELDQLTRRVDALEKQGGAKATVLPSDEEIEKSFSIMERFFRRFMGIIEETRPDGELSPNRT